MRRTFTDKLILMALTLIVVVGNSVMGFEEGISTGVVVAVLMTAAAYGITELFTYRYLPYILGGVSIILFLVTGGNAAFVFPAIGYAIASDKKTNIVLRVFIPAALCALALKGDINIALEVTALSIASCYLAIGTTMTTERVKTLTDNFDKAREDAIKEHKRRQSAMMSSENDIYLATLKERNRIARDIHDNVGHVLTRSIVQMEAVKVINKDETVKPYLDSVSDSLNNAMTSIRRSVHELHDDSIDLSVGLNDLIKVLDGKFEVKLITSIESPVSNEFKNMVLGIVKEALTNISKYSKGDKVKVEVVENNTFWRIFVWDNGPCDQKDMSDADFDTSGIGLDNIRDRAGRFKGKARIFSDMSGFTVLVTVPKEDKDDQSHDRR